MKMILDADIHLDDDGEEGEAARFFVDVGYKCLVFEAEDEVRARRRRVPAPFRSRPLNPLPYTRRAPRTGSRESSDGATYVRSPCASPIAHPA